jgi:FAD:protein FMN transferase
VRPHSPFARVARFAITVPSTVRLFIAMLGAALLVTQAATNSETDVAAASVATAAAVAAAGAAPETPRTQLSRIELTEPHMGTQMRLVVYASDETRARTAMRAAFDRVADLNRTLSDYQPTSELMRFCARAGHGPIPVSADLFRILDVAQTLAHRTSGAFDVTSGPLTHLWRRARRFSEVPAAPRVTEALALTGYRHLHLDASTRTAALDTPGMTLDLGGLAKGFAADEAIAVLESSGLTRALAALGGDVVVSAPPPDRDGWSIDVSSLDVPGAPRPGTLVLRDAAISTAGDAEQWMTADGVRYSHILDPRTGWPMTIRSSTTVIARRGLDADRLDTAIAILGPDEGLPLAEETPGAAVLSVRQQRDGRVTIHQSSRWPAPVLHTEATHRIPGR